MPRIADYTVILDGSVTLPDDGTPHDLPSFDAPSLDAGSKIVLAFRVDPIEPVSALRVTLNGHSVAVRAFNTSLARSWHEVIRGGILRATNNTLSVAIDNGRMIVSDAVVHFQANI